MEEMLSFNDCFQNVINVNCLKSRNHKRMKEYSNNVIIFLYYIYFFYLSNTNQKKIYL